jgi:hypothetical protein
MTEEGRILAEVERRRKSAKELGLFDLLNLFRDHVEFLEGGPDPERLPKSVTDVKVRDTKSGNDSIKAREIWFGSRSYIFSFSERYGTSDSGDIYLTGRLVLVREGQTVLDLSFSGTVDLYLGAVWEPNEVEAFIEGDWLQEIDFFAQEVADLAAERRNRSQEQTKNHELEELKRKFGRS